MESHLSELVARFAGLDVLVIGDVMLDRTIRGVSVRKCPDSDAPVVDQVGEALEYLGGAANVAANVAAMGAGVALVGVIGDDAEGDRILELIDAAGVLDGLVRVRGRRTLCKTRVEVGGELVARCDRGDVGELDQDRCRQIYEAIGGSWPGVEVVIASDYEKGVLGPVARGCLAYHQATSPKCLVVDARDLSKYRNCSPTAVTPSYLEAMKLASADKWERYSTRPYSIDSLAPRILRGSGARIVAVTLDEEGAMILDGRNRPARTNPAVVDRAHPSGAGDTYTSAFALTLGAGGDRFEAGEVAQAAADVVVAKPGTATCSAGELVDRFEPPQRRRVVLATGCFDCLHDGHITFLKAAAAAGDFLVVGLNTDASVRELKGPSRPLKSFDRRRDALLALPGVGQVIAIGSDPRPLISNLKPRVYAKGGDYERETLPEAALVERHGGEVLIVPRVEGFSTTGVVARRNNSA